MTETVEWIDGFGTVLGWDGGGGGGGGVQQCCEGPNQSMLHA